MFPCKPCHCNYCERKSNISLNLFHLNLEWIQMTKVNAKLHKKNIFSLLNCPVNLHPLFLFWKPGWVCDPEKNQVQSMDLNKIRSKVWTWKKQVAKKQGHCYSKREEARLPFLFLNNNDPAFLHPAFFRSIFWTWFF